VLLAIFYHVGIELASSTPKLSRTVRIEDGMHAYRTYSHAFKVLYVELGVSTYCMYTYVELGVSNICIHMLNLVLQRLRTVRIHDGIHACITSSS
jgi:hypothetical protein